MSSPNVNDGRSTLQRVLESRRLVLTVTLLIATVGILSFMTMKRQEDPFFPYRAALITSLLPGGDPERIQKLLVQPLEEELASISEVKVVESTIRNNVASTLVQTQEYIYDTDKVWDKVRNAIDRAYAQFPQGVARPTIDDRVITTTTAAYAVTGSDDLQRLADTGKQLRDRILNVGNLIRVRLLGDPEQQITIALDDQTLRSLNISSAYLVNQLAPRTQIIPGGSVVADSRQLTLQPLSDFASVEELQQTPVRLPTGDVVPLASIADVWLGRKEPVTGRVWFDGRPAVLVDAIGEQNIMNTVAFGKKLEAVVNEMRDELKAANSDLQIERMFYNPARVKDRLDGLSQSLVYAMAIILIVLFMAMGLRMGLIVAVILPLVAAISLAIYAFGGGVLHQMAVIGIVISLGILVDNAIVMVEDIQWRLDRGASSLEASLTSARSLAGPLGAATGTTLASFMPMLLSKGGSADFTRALPVVIIISLIASYLFAVLVTPILARAFLKAKKQTGKATKLSLVERIGDFAGKAGVRYAWLVMTLAILGILGTGFVAKNYMQFEFFPQADRDQVVIDIELPEGTEQSSTERVVRKMERQLREWPEALKVHAFIGFSGPDFYYNLKRRENEPHTGRLAVVTPGLQDNLRLIAAVREYAAKNLPEARVTANILSQGPPVDAPIVVRVFQPDPKKLSAAVEQVFRALSTVPGAIGVAQDMGQGAPTIEYQIDDAAALQFGVTRADVAQALLGRTRGLSVGTYWAADDPVPIVVRSRAGDQLDPQRLDNIAVFGATGKSVPLMAVATPKLAWKPGVVHTRNQRRVALVKAYLDFDYAFSGVLNAAKPKLEALELPSGTQLEFGGEAESSGDANGAILKTAPVGAVMLLFFLLLQFNSFRRVSIVMLTVPLGFIGVFPGLVLMGIPFGFQPLLGCIALIGIVVNNAIVMLDVMDENLRSGVALDEAIFDAVRRRVRPIFLTTLTTIAGLLPLALSKSTLWPPMAWALIFGLMSSAVLTIFVVPALCHFMLGKRDEHLTATPALTAIIALVVVAGMASPQAQATNLTLIEAVTRVDTQPALQGALQREKAAASAQVLAKRQGYLPLLEVTGQVSRVNNASSFSTPAGTFDITDRNQASWQVSLQQPLLDLAQQRYRTAAAAASVDAEQWRTLRLRQELQMAVVESWLGVLSVNAQLNTLGELKTSLGAQLKKLQALVRGGRALKADQLEVQLALDRVAQQQAVLSGRRDVGKAQLSRLVGLPIYALIDTDLPPNPSQLANASLQHAKTGRADFVALVAAERESRLQQQAVNAERWPTLGAALTFQQSDGNPFLPDDEARIGLQMRWQPFASGTREPRKAILAAQQLGLAAQQDDLLRTIEVQLAEARAGFTTAKANATLSASAIRSARQTLKTRKARFDAGRATVDDVLDAESALAQQQAVARTSRYEQLAAWVRYEFVLGVSPLMALAKL